MAVLLTSCGANETDRAKKFRERWLAAGKRKSRFGKCHAIDPVTYGHLLKGRRVLMIAGSNDEITPPVRSAVGVDQPRAGTGLARRGPLYGDCRFLPQEPVRLIPFFNAANDQVMQRNLQEFRALHVGYFGTLAGSATWSPYSSSSSSVFFAGRLLSAAVLHRGVFMIAFVEHGGRLDDIGLAPRVGIGLPQCQGHVEPSTIRPKTVWLESFLSRAQLRWAVGMQVRKNCEPPESLAGVGHAQAPLGNACGPFRNSIRRRWCRNRGLRRCHCRGRRRAYSDRRPGPRNWE